MKIEVDRAACLRSTQCSYLHPELFDRDAEDFPVPKVQHPGEDLREAIADAIELCPASAIRLVEDGNEPMAARAASDLGP